MKTLKNGQKQAMKFDRLSKNAKHRFYQQTFYKLRNREGGSSVLVNYQSFVSKMFPLAPPSIFLYKI